MSGNGIQTIDNLGVFRFQPLCLLHVVVSSVQWKDIHIQTRDTRYMPVLNKCGVPIGNLGEIQRIGRVGVRRNNLIIAKILFLGNLQETVVVGTRHDDINIIVPRNDAVMAHRPYSRTCTAIVSELMPFAYLHKGFQYIKNSGIPPFLYLFYVHNTLLFTIHNTLQFITTIVSNILFSRQS